jgi:hypothetical protein
VDAPSSFWNNMQVKENEKI